MHWIIKLLIGLVALLVTGAATVWLILAVPFFSDIRSAFAERFLSDQMGFPVVIDGDVSVRLGRVTRLNASGLYIPTEDMVHVNRADLGTFEVDVDLVDLWNGRFDLDNLRIWDLHVSVEAERLLPVRENDGAEAAPKKSESEQSILSFLRTRTVDITNVTLIAVNTRNGFEFDFELAELDFDQVEDGEALNVFGEGAVNDQSFALEGYFPNERPFEVTFDFGDATMNYSGTPAESGYAAGYDAQFELDVRELSSFFEAFRLQPALSGTARMSSRVEATPEQIGLADLSIEVNLAEGHFVGVTGSVENFGQREGVDLSAVLRLYPEGQPPAPARSLDELRLTDMSATLRGEAGGFEFDEFFVSSNAFNQEISEVGPVRIGRIERSTEGALVLEDISIQAGPRDAPYIKATGDVGNVLNFTDFSFSGALDAPASLVLSQLGDEVAEAFGGLEASFVVDDSDGVLSLRELDARATDTEIWEFDARARSKSVTSLDGLEVDAKLGFVDGAQFLSALNLKPVFTGPLSLSAMVRGHNAGLDAELGLTSGSSDLSSALSFDLGQTPRRIDASIVSEALDVATAKKAFAAIAELQKVMERSEADAGSEASESDEIEIQPLVLPEEEPGLGDLIDRTALLAETDANVTIDFKRISGVPGLTSVSSDFELVEGKARLGPLDLAFAGGALRFGARMDLIETPHLLSVSGSTSGWDLADILRTLNIDFQANGALAGNFSLSGNRTSVDSFLNSMYGSAEIDMNNGQVATSLLELAGLGIFPWLFSQERRQGYTDVVCVQAPVRISAGRMSFDQVVAETRSVQMVAQGFVDWNADAIALRAEPRPVGRPLARSAWPFDVTGKLSEPKFKLDIGGSRQRREDGADQMPTQRVPCQRDILQLQ